MICQWKWKDLHCLCEVGRSAKSFEEYSDSHNAVRKEPEKRTVKIPLCDWKKKGMILSVLRLVTKPWEKQKGYTWGIRTWKSSSVKVEILINDLIWSTWCCLWRAGITSPMAPIINWLNFYKQMSHHYKTKERIKQTMKHSFDPQSLEEQLWICLQPCENVFHLMHHLFIRSGCK